MTEHAETRRGINFCSNHLAQAFTMSSYQEGLLRESEGFVTMLATAHVDVTYLLLLLLLLLEDTLV